MKQRFLPGLPEGAPRIGEMVSILEKDGQVTYFLGGDNHYAHPVGERQSHRFTLTSLMANRHLRAVDLPAALIRELFVSSADIEPDDQAKTLTLRIHRMASPAHERAIASLRDEPNPFPPPRNRRQDDLLPGLNSNRCNHHLRRDQEVCSYA